MLIKIVTNIRKCNTKKSIKNFEKIPKALWEKDKQFLSLADFL